MTLSIATLLAESALRRPDKAAVVIGPSSTTYAELWEQARRYAALAQHRGVAPGLLPQLGVRGARRPYHHRGFVRPPQRGLGQKGRDRQRHGVLRSSAGPSPATGCRLSCPRMAPGTSRQRDPTPRGFTRRRPGSAPGSAPASAGPAPASASAGSASKTSASS